MNLSLYRVVKCSADEIQESFFFLFRWNTGSSVSVYSDSLYRIQPKNEIKFDCMKKRKYNVEKEKKSREDPCLCVLV